MKSTATFRGVPFFVESVELGTGRVNALQVFPFRETAPFAEDMGRRARTFPVEAHVVGNEHAAARDRLLKALETPGPGELVHPTFGTVRVVVGPVRVRESRDESKITRFSIEFAETSTTPSQPSIVEDPSAKVTAAAAVADVAASNQFLDTYQDFSALRDSVANQIRSVSLTVGKVLDKVALEAQSNANLRRQLATLKNNAFGLVNAPGVIVSSMIGVLDELAAGIAATPFLLDPSSVFLGLYGFNPGDRPVGTTTNRIVEQQNFDAVQLLFQRLTLTRAATLAIGQTFASYDDALGVRNALANLIDQHLDIATDDTYPSLAQIRADLVNAVPGVSSALPRLQRLTPASTVPSLVLAYRLYGSVALEADMLTRNRIANPALVPGGVELEILSRGN